MPNEVTITLKGVDQLSGVIEGAAGGLADLGGIASGALTAGLAVGAAGIAALGAGLVFSVGQALEAEQGQAMLAQVLKSTGGAAGVTADEANALAQEFAHLAGGSDDAILAIEQIGLRAGNVAEKDFPAFIQTSLDLGVVMGSSEAAATLLARAHDDVSAAVGKAEKQGIFFTDAQKAQIKALQDSGDAAGAMELFMGRLGEATGGAALANSQTLTGQLELFKGQLGEAAETIGTAVLPLLTQLFQGVIAPAIPLLTEFANVIASSIGNLASGDIRAGLEGLGEDLFNVFPPEVAGPLNDALNVLSGFLQNELPASMAAAQIAIQPLVDATLNLVAAFQSSMPMIIASVQGMVDFVINLFNIFAPTIIANVTDTLNTVAAFWTAHGDQVMAIVTVLFQVISTTIGVTLTLISGIISATLTLITGIWTAADALLQGDTTAAWTAIQTMVTTAMTTIQTTITTIMNAILSIVGMNLTSFIASWTGTFSLAMLIVSTFFSNLIATWTGNWNNALAIVRGFIGNTIGAVIGFAGQILAWFSATVDSIQSAFKIDWGAIGTGMIDGIKGGVMSAAGGLAQEAANAVGAAIQAAKDAMGWNSPPAAFVNLGSGMMGALAQGITQNARLPMAAMAGATGQMVSVANDNSAHINVDARGAQRGVGREVERAVDRSLKRKGGRSDTRLRMRGEL